MNDGEPNITAIVGESIHDCNNIIFELFSKSKLNTEEMIDFMGRLRIIRNEIVGPVTDLVAMQKELKEIP